ncbi:MAG TPA: sulfatase [Armatimonadota bacterium]|nr:sulfatase [Armatimonadota bacterium]
MTLLILIRWQARPSAHEPINVVRLADIVQPRAPQVTEAVVREFNFEDGPQGWQPTAGVESLRVIESALVGAVGVEGAALEWPCAVEAETVTHIVLSISASADGVIGAHWLGADGSPAGSVVSPVHGVGSRWRSGAASDGDSVCQIIALPVGTSAQWKGRISLIRIALRTPAGTRFRIERLAVVNQEVGWVERDDRVVVRRFKFDGSEGASGWIGIDGATVHAAPGKPLTFRSDRAGGAIWCGISLDAATVTQITVAMDIPEGRAIFDTARLFWGVADGLAPSGERYLDVRTYAGKGMQTYVFNVGQAPAWRGHIRWLAIMPDTERDRVEARIGAIACEHHSTRRVRFDDELRTALPVPDGERFAHRVTVPRRAAFSCSVGLTGAASGEAITITVGVTPDGARRRTVVAERRVEPGSVEAARWIDVSADLRRWGGRAVTLDIEARTAGRLSGFALANPEIRSRPRGRGGRRPPNIVILDLDALRPDHLGCYGYDLPTSPNIDALAACSTLFERAYSQANWTLASHASLFTGKLPTDLGMVLDTDKLSGDERTLAELLRERGYATAGFAEGGFMGAEFGMDQGFDVYYDTRLEPDIAQTTEHLSRWLEAHAEQPFFLFFHTYEAHDWVALRRHHLDPFLRTPYNGRLAGDYNLREELKEPDYVPTWPDADDIAYMKALYDGEIRCADEYVGRILGLLAALGRADNTIVVLTSDHGEAFLENPESFGHGGRLTNALIQVPLLIRLPGQVTTSRVREAIGSYSLFATLLEMAGALPPADAAPSLAQFLAGRAALPRNLLVSTVIHQWALTSGRHKFYIFLAGTGAYPSSNRALFDLEADPEEDYNISWKEQRLAAEMSRTLVERIAERARFTLLRPYGGEQEMRVTLRGSFEYAVAAGQGARFEGEQDSDVTFNFPSGGAYRPVILCMAIPGEAIEIEVACGETDFPASRVFVGEGRRHPETMPFTIGAGALSFRDLSASVPPRPPEGEEPYLMVYQFHEVSAEPVELTEERRKQLEALGYM